MNLDFNFSTPRRDLFRLAGGLALTGFSLPELIQAQSATSDLIPFQRFPRMVHNYYHKKILAVEKQALAKKTALTSRAKAETYIKSVREKIAHCFSSMPTEKTPLNAKVTGILDRDTYTVEKIIFESRPNFYVTANFYLPKNRPGGKVPGVVGSCGHSVNGKAADAYQSFAQGLARLGTACLIFDPVGQGERSQYFNADGEFVIKGTTAQHHQMGTQMVLLGEFLGEWRAWDGIRALDYLLSRPEIDQKHVGITGNSGGGTLSTWLIGLDRRWTMGAPACFVTTWRRNFENELAQDNEQCPPRSLALGLDHDDYLAAMAPKPIIILAQSRDFFDVRGAEETYARLKHLYTLLGAEDQIELQIGPDPHGYTQPNREAMYRFFNSITKASDQSSEPEIVLEDESDLYASPHGQVVLGLASKTVFSFGKEKAETLKEARDAAPKSPDALRSAILASLKLPRRNQSEAPEYRIIRAVAGKRQYPLRHWINYAVKTEPGIEAICTVLSEEPNVSRLVAAPAGKGEAILWIAEHSADQELRENEVLRELVAARSPETLVIACDVRGVGESLPGTAGNRPMGQFGADYFYAAYADMLGQPYLGGKTHDVLRVIDLLAAQGWDKIHLVAQGFATLPGGLAAFLDDRVTQVTLLDRLESWHSLAVDEHYKWPLSHMLYGVLEHWDLPEVWAQLDQQKAVKA